MQREKYFRNYKTGGSIGGEYAFIMNGDGNGTLGYSPATQYLEMTGGNTFGGRAYELTVGGDSSSSRGKFTNQYMKKQVTPFPTSIFDQIEDNLHPYKKKKRN